MSKHEDWEAARERRNMAAVHITRAVINNTGRNIARELATFQREDANMARIEAGLEPKQEHTEGETA
jgi:hypothetical protein